MYHSNIQFDSGYNDQDYTQCETCNGNGILSDCKWGDAVGKTCHNCEGTGKYEICKCPDCKGFGMVYDMDETLKGYPCEECDGTGVKDMLAFLPEEFDDYEDTPSYYY